jgi:CRISPR/Cas system CSM-associated protein Csm3 (group 7 of RAMP superfamily)
MPQDESFWNPYRMIPAKQEIRRKPPLTDERFVAKSGVIYCSLENLTPLFVGKNRNNSEQFLTRTGKYVIPGSSLKGMLRSLAEIVGGGCFVTDPKGQYAAEYAACSKACSLCKACRTFGMMERGKGAKVHKGNVSVSDAILREGEPTTHLFEVLLYNKGTRHEPFYRSPHTGSLDGRSCKFYSHQPKRTESVPTVPAKLKSNTWNINALLPGHHFDFEVHFCNLRQEELELLIYVLALEEHVVVEIGEQKLALQGPLRHKIGNAKPLGMGSCQITINKLVYFAAPKIRFSSLQQTGNSEYGGAVLKDEVCRLVQNIVNDKSETMQQLRKMMVWDENDPREFRYPDYHWFQNPANSQKALKAI